MWIRTGFIVGSVIASLSFAQVETGAPSSAPTTAPTTQEAMDTRAVVISLSGPIDEYSRERLFERFGEVREMGVSRVILKINTYGGRVDAALDITRFIRQQDDMEVIAYVEDKAISAGAMIALSADEVVMEPETLIGDAAPIAVAPGGGMQELAPTERAKAESPVLEDFYASAVKNGYDPLLVSSMVSVGRTVHWIENIETGARRFVDAAEYGKLTTGEDSKVLWKPVEGVRDPIDAADTLLTMNADLAAKVGINKQTVKSVDALAAARGWVITARLEPTVNDIVMSFLNGTLVRGGLMTVLMFSLYMAFSQPGHGAPEAAALIALGVLLGVPMLTGYAQWYEVVAVLLGLVLIALEIFVIPGFGLPGISGLFLVLGGLTMTFLPPLNMPGMPTGFGISLRSVADALGVVAGAMTASLLLWWWLSRFLPTLPYFSKLVLHPSGDGATVNSTPMIGGAGVTVWPAVGMVGRVATDLRPGGLVEFLDETTNDVRSVDVICDAGFVAKGTEVVVKRSGGSSVVVRPV